MISPRPRDIGPFGPETTISTPSRVVSPPDPPVVSPAALSTNATTDPCLRAPTKSSPAPTSPWLVVTGYWREAAPLPRTWWRSALIWLTLPSNADGVPVLLVAIHFGTPILGERRSCGLFGPERLVRVRFDADGLLEQPVEEKSTMVRPAAVEAEGELVQVVVELLVADSALVGAQQPPLEQARDAVDFGHQDMRGIVGLAEVGDRVQPVATVSL